MFKEFMEYRSNFEPIEQGALFDEFKAWCIAAGRENPFRTQIDFGVQFKDSIVGLGRRRTENGQREWVFPPLIGFVETQVDYTADVIAFMREIGVKAKEGDQYTLVEAFKEWLGDRKPPQKASLYALLKKIYGAKRVFVPLNTPPFSNWKWEFPEWDEERGAIEIGAFLSGDKDAEIARLKAEIVALKREIATLKGENS